MTEDNDTSETPTDDDKEKRGKKGKKKDKKTERVYTGTKDPVDRAFAEWINRQWARGEHLDKIDLIEFFPKGAMKGFGQVVAFELFTTAHDVDMEEAVELANMLHGRAQLSCDRLHRDKKEMLYYARAFDKGRSSVLESIDTFPIVIKPRTIYFDGHGGGNEEDEDARSERTYALDYMREVIKAKQADDSRDDHNVGEILNVLLARDAAMHQRQMELYGVIHKFAMDWVGIVREAADSAPQRELLKVKTEMIRDGFRVGKNLLTGAMGAVFDKDMSGDENSKGPTYGNGSNGKPANGARPVTRERMLIEEFFRDCQGAGIDVPLFGQWETGPDNVARCVKPGVITPDQWIIIMNVFRGNAPAEALNDLLMDSGKPLALTPQQLVQAQQLEGMTEGIASSLVTLMSVLKKKRDAAREAAAAETPTNSEEE